MIRNDDAYWTLDGAGTAETKVKGSRFLGFVCPVQTRNEVETHLQRIRKKYYDATHHCYAFRIGAGGEDFRASDGGEPTGTAGKPILDAIDGQNLTDVFCLITRYFGGTKLGTGGLARAYGDCAAITLGAVKRIQKFVNISSWLTFPYKLTGTVMSILSARECQIAETRYSEDTKMLIQIRMSQREALMRQLKEATAGKIVIDPVEEDGH